MEKAKKSKKLNRKEKAAIERKELRAKLLKSYQKGESNLEYDKLTSSEIWEISFKTYPNIEEREKALGRPLPLITKKKWLERELAKAESKKPKIPTYRVQDPEVLTAKYQQKFIETAKELHPQCIEDLREIAPYFSNLFAKESKEPYYEILNNLIYKLIPHWRVFPSQYLPDALAKQDQKYLWGLIEGVFYLSRAEFMSICDEPEVVSDETRRSIEYGKHTINGFTSVIKQTFKETAADQDSILLNYLRFQGKIFDWVNKYNLKKDWLVEYAHFLIYQFSQNPEIEIQDVEIALKNCNHYQTYYHPFEFETAGWWASDEGETAKVYMTRVTEEFNLKLKLYIEEASTTLKLDNLPKATNPPTFENVAWLLCWTVKNWDEEKIIEKFFPEISGNKTKNDLTWKAFESKKKHIQKEIKTLAAYDLPVRTA